MPELDPILCQHKRCARYAAPGMDLCSPCAFRRANRRAWLHSLISLVVYSALILGVLLASPVLGDAPYFETFPDVDGCPVYPSAVSRNGKYVAGGIALGSGDSHAWRWSRRDGLSILPPGDHGWWWPDEWGLAAQNNGIVGGSSFRYPTEWGGVTGSPTALPGDWEEGHATILDYNLDGTTTIGGWSYECWNDDHVVWNENGLHVFDVEGHFTAISPDGRWATDRLERETPDPCDPDYDGALWDLTDFSIHLLEAPAGIDTLAQAANDVSQYGAVVVGSTLVSGDGPVGAIWDHTAFRCLLPGTLECVSVSADGTRITCDTRRDLGNEVVLYEVTPEDITYTPIVDLGIAAGLDISGWYLADCYDADGQGLTWVGRCQSPAGEWMGYVLHIPEPSTLLLLTVGLVLRRR